MKVLIINKDRLYRIIANIVICIVFVIVVGVAMLSPESIISSSTNNKAIYSGNQNKNNVSIMINVYWGDEFIEPILNCLKENDVRATFFVGGVWVSKNNELLKKIYNDGHEIGNHGYFHKDHTTLTDEKNREEIYQTHLLVKELIGIDMTLFAPPSGAYNNKTLEIANNLNYKTIMWSKDTIDWRDKDENLIYSRATNNAKNGDLILMHPTQETLSALPKIIEFYKNNNFNLTTVSNNINA